MKALTEIFKQILFMKERECGILLHISSLPSKYGIGSLGKEAYEFVDFLKKSNCNIWQILPLNVTSFGDSPYQSPSNYGLNYYFIDLDTLINKKLLTKEEVTSTCWGNNEERVDYGILFNNRLKVLRKAFNRFDKTNLEFKEFIKNNPQYKDFAIFMVLKDINHLKPWYEWENKYKTYSLELEKELIQNNKDDILFYIWTQYEFLNEYNSLKEYAHKNKIKIMGDLPIYVAFDSLEVWKYPSLFELDSNHYPVNVAGCPPDCFSVDGQLWGNPLYNWTYHKETNYKWWNERINNALKFFDYLRIDHFRGFSGYYSIPFKDTTAKNGKWIKGPGFDLFKDKLDYPIVAEDLGMIDDDFIEFFNKCGYPGMKIVTQCFDDPDKTNIWRPSNYTYNFFSYSGTHDSQTCRQFIDDLTKDEKKMFLEILEDECKRFRIPFVKDLSNKELTLKVCELNIASSTKAAILPLQDLFAIGAEGRMNFPSTLGSSNWSWRITKKLFDKNKKEVSSMLLRWNDNYQRGD